MNKDEAMRFISDYMKEIKEQDNRGTSSPYFYVIRTSRWIPSYHNDEWERFTYVLNDAPEWIFTIEDKSKEIDEYKNFYKEYYESDCLLSDDQIERAISAEFSIYGENKKWQEECCFFTESDAKKHLEANSYHYSDDAHTYIKHCWRAPQLEKFFKAINVICNI